jgi:hypothetical protein
VVADRDMDSDVFVLSDMTIEVHDLPHGRVIGFNGTTEWALDSVDKDSAVWLPRESQLRELLAGTFRGLDRTDNGWRVRTELNGAAHATENADAEEALRPRPAATARVAAISDAKRAETSRRAQSGRRWAVRGDPEQPADDLAALPHAVC